MSELALALTAYFFGVLIGAFSTAIVVALQRKETDHE